MALYSTFENFSLSEEDFLWQESYLSEKGLSYNSYLIFPL